ncbi:hypothetical protein VTL71DRAFT_12147 [Oculimacula yallundae]|uniref:Uncharacterized protein n=1 Tax=Oculimacula yallundae TaxID=86028 RepID=A0ABR4CS43_9HELO
MFVSVGFVIGSLAIHGVASHSLFNHRGLIAEKRVPNGTVTTSESVSSSITSIPCTTTVTSILGEQFSPPKGSCSQTITITSTIQPTESISQSATSKTSTSITTSSSSTTTSSALTSSKASIPVPTFDPVTSTIQPEGSSKPHTPLPPFSPTLTLPIDCITIVTSILGKFLVMETGSCGQTVTIISTIQSSSVPEPTPSITRSSDVTLTSVITSTSIILSPITSSTSTSISVSTSTPAVSSANPSPEPCTETVTSILGKLFIPVIGLCSKTVTVISSGLETSGPQTTSNSKSHPPIPTNTEIGPFPPITTPAATTSGAVSSISVPTEQFPQSAPIPTTTSTPELPIPVTTTTTTPELPNPITTTSPGNPDQITTSSVFSPSDVPATQEPQTSPNTSQEPIVQPCDVGCTGPRPTTSPESVSTYSTYVPDQTLTETPTGTSTSGGEQGPISTQEPIITTKVETTSVLGTPSAPASIITSSPIPVAVVIGSQTIIQDTASNFIIGTQTLIPGSAITINGQQIYAASSGGAIILNPAPPRTTSSPPTEASPVPAPTVVIVDGTSITGNTESGFVIGTQTLFVGSAITASGQVITLPPPPATQVPAATITQTPETVPVILIGSSTFTQNTESAFVIGSQTLSPGSAVTISGQVISLSPTGNAVIVNGATPTQNPTTFSTEIQAPVTSLVVAGQTLTAGGRVTVGGDVLSLAGGAITVIGTVTVAGEQAVVTAKPTGKKSLGGRLESTSSILMALQVLFVFGLGAFGLF